MILSSEVFHNILSFLDSKYIFYNLEYVCKKFEIYVNYFYEVHIDEFFKYKYYNINYDQIIYILRITDNDIYICDWCSKLFNPTICKDRYGCAGYICYGCDKKKLCGKCSRDDDEFIQCNICGYRGLCIDCISYENYICYYCDSCKPK